MSIIALKEELLKEARRIRPIRVDYYSIWVNYKGKRLRILAGVSKMSDSTVKATFAFQSPKDEDSYERALKLVRDRIESNKWCVSMKAPKGKFVKENLYFLAFLFVNEIKRINWFYRATLECVEQNGLTTFIY